MFTGIVEAKGTIREVAETGTNRIFRVESPLSESFKVDQSVSHSGVCLTVESVNGQTHQVTAIEETLRKTNVGDWQPGTVVNLERCLGINARLDGHFVQGHVDAKGECLKRKDRQGSWEFVIRFPRKFASLIIEKGSIALNGVSLTAFDVGKNEFTVAIIPYTYEHTNLGLLNAGDHVNLEFDLLGKYIQRKLKLDEK